MSKKNRAAQAILGALLGAALLAGTAIPAHADQDDRCRRGVHRAEQNLDRAIRKHGEHSRQAEERRHQLEEVREHCQMRDEHRDEDRRDQR